MISVIVPVYNGEKYIKRCIESILAQNFKEFELIIINDGSTDNTSNIIREYNDKRVRIINQKNKGTGFSRNLGISLAKKEYIVFIDSDDEIEDNYLKVMSDLITDYKCDIVCTSSCRLKNTNKIMVMDKELGFNKLIELPEKLCVSVIRKMFKKSIINNIKFDNSNKFEDIDFVFKAFLNAEKIVFIDKYLYKYYDNTNSRSKYYLTNDRLYSCLGVYNMISTKYNKLFNNYISYCMFNAIAITNMMIINNDFRCYNLKEINSFVKKNIKYLKKSFYPIYKKIQIYLYAYNFNLYKHIYINIRGNKWIK